MARTPQPTRDMMTATKNLEDGNTGFDMEAWHVMQRRDDALVRDELMHGAASTKFVYRFPIRGQGGSQEVVGVSVVGARQLAAHYGGIRHRIIGAIQKDGARLTMQTYPNDGSPMRMDLQIIHDLADEPDFYGAIVEVTDVKNGNSVQVEVRENKFEQRRDGTSFLRPHYPQIAQSKAYRNGVLALISQDIRLNWMQRQLELGKDEIITTSVIDEKRDAVLRYATAKGIAVNEHALNALRMEQISGLADAARENREGGFRTAAMAAGLARRAEPFAEDARQIEHKGSASTTTASDAGGGGQRSAGAAGPGQQQTASRDTDDRQQQPTADKFESYVVDHMGEAVGEGEIFGDPGQWIDAYHELIDKAFPADTAAIIENNRETVAWLLAKMPGLSKTKQLTEDGSRPDKSDADRRSNSGPQAVEVPTRGQSQRDMKGYVEAVRKSVTAEIVDADSAAKWLARNEPIMSKLPPATRASAMQAYNARLDALGLGSGKAPEGDEEEQTATDDSARADENDPDRRQFELWVNDIRNVTSTAILDSYLSNKAYTTMLARFERERPQFAESIKTAVDAKKSELQRLGR